MHDILWYSDCLEQIAVTLVSQIVVLVIELRIVLLATLAENRMLHDFVRVGTALG